MCVFWVACVLNRLRFLRADCGSFSNKEMSGKKTVSSARASEAREKATDKLDVKEFRDRFCIPNGVSIELLNE